MTKKFTMFLLAGSLLSGCTSSSQDNLSSIELVSENAEVLVNEKTDIDIRTDPASQKLEKSDFDAGEGKIEVDGDTAVFSAEKTGTYTIRASKDGISSNPVSIKVAAPKDSPDTARKDASSSREQNSRSACHDLNSSSLQQQTDSQNQTAVQSETELSANTGVQKHDTDSQQAGDRLSVDQLMADPDVYVGRKVEVMGYFPQDTPLSAGSPTDTEGRPMAAIYNDSSTQGIAIDADSKTVDEKAQGSRYVRIAGTFEKKDFGGLDYGIKMDDLVVLNPGFPNSYGRYLSPGSPVSQLKQTGRITFTEDGVNIRNGVDGLESPKSGYVYDAGMTVNYDRLYEKDGYTWVSYIGRSGQRHSVAIGDNDTILYGYAAVPY